VQRRSGNIFGKMIFFVIKEEFTVEYTVGAAPDQRAQVRNAVNIVFRLIVAQDNIYEFIRFVRSEK